jgi:hypothetical protein
MTLGVHGVIAIDRTKGLVSFTMDNRAPNRAPVRASTLSSGAR